ADPRRAEVPPELRAGAGPRVAAGAAALGEERAAYGRAPALHRADAREGAEEHGGAVGGADAVRLAGVRPQPAGRSGEAHPGAPAAGARAGHRDGTGAGVDAPFGRDDVSRLPDVGAGAAVAGADPWSGGPGGLGGEPDGGDGVPARR